MNAKGRKEDRFVNNNGKVRELGNNSFRLSESLGSRSVDYSQPLSHCSSIHYVETKTMNGGLASCESSWLFMVCDFLTKINLFDIVH
ncbi:unnamed protein product [Ambrosiozyma monospora]|uniref:Unnamed protein product n=1 Tax=Ambrosiozyma monospora TaxID=43982 RepID=A0ACB5T673_AMBMO|nr:unnamed protein product [Ambrosiozyma monospora]